jgi:hypothetical protein
MLYLLGQIAEFIYNFMVAILVLIGDILETIFKFIEILFGYSRTDKK